MADASEETERTLCQLPQCHVFKIPTLKSAGGHRASDWPKDPMWTGKVKIVARGRLAVITLLDANNSVFAVCPVTDEAAVERTVDSGRYFALRIQNAQGRHAYIGIAFNERNDSFDFNVALAEHKAECEREDKANAEQSSSGSSSQPHRDLAIKEGEKIKINIGGAKRERKASLSGTGGGLLAPPPGKGLLAPPPQKAGSVHRPGGAAVTDSLIDASFAATPSSSSSSVSHDDPFGFPTASSASVPASVFKSIPSTSSPALDPFGFPLSSFPAAAPAPAPVSNRTTAAPSQSAFGTASEPNLLDL